MDQYWGLIKEDEAEVLQCVIIDEGVHNHPIKKYCATDAWTLSQEAMTIKMCTSAINVFMTWMNHYLLYVIIVSFGTTISVLD